MNLRNDNQPIAFNVTQQSRDPGGGAGRARASLVALEEEVNVGSAITTHCYAKDLQLLSLGMLTNRVPPAQPLRRMSLVALESTGKGWTSAVLQGNWARTCCPEGAHLGSIHCLHIRSPDLV
jgi:hypothetical protein